MKSIALDCDLRIYSITEVAGASGARSREQIAYCRREPLMPRVPTKATQQPFNGSKSITEFGRRLRVAGVSNKLLGAALVGPFPKNSFYLNRGLAT